jgi:hypothetical protein
MKIYLLEPKNHIGINDYNQYDKAVVVAKNEYLAKLIHPDGDPRPINEREYKFDDWPDDPEEIKVTYLGEAVEGMEAGVICASL